MSKEKHPFQVAAAPPRPLGRGTLAAVWLAVGFLFVAAYAVLFGGVDSLSFVYHLLLTGLLSAFNWTLQAPAWVLIVGVAVLAVAARYCLPVVEYTQLGALDNRDDRATKHRLYRPGSFQVQGENAAWKEGRSTAYTNKAHVKRVGLTLRIIVPVERTVSGRTVTYDGREISTYRSVLKEQMHDDALDELAWMRQQERRRRRRESG